MSPKLLVLYASFANFGKACTTVRVMSGNGVPVIGRTLELGSHNLPEYVTNEVMWRMMTVPRGVEGNDLGYVAISGMKQAGSIENPATEGMNEAGLCVSAQSFNYQRDASYQTKTGGDEPVVLGQGVVTFLLRSAETVADAVKLMKSVRVIDDPEFSATLGRAHWAIQDAGGGFAVIEYVDGELQCHSSDDNPSVAAVGVLTNDPDWDFQMKNLNQYSLYSMNSVQQSPWANLPEGLRPTDETYHVVGHGQNTIGLPGSYTPQDRFVKMNLLRNAAQMNTPPGLLDTVDDAIVLATGLLNTVHIPMGVLSNTPEGVAEGPEWTAWAVVKVPSEKRFLVRTYSAMGWREVKLSDIDFDAKEVKSYPLYHGLHIRPFDMDPVVARPRLENASKPDVEVAHALLVAGLDDEL
mmetsp:Transcript_7158/g.22579  ORF Transcript_7158/g.22579 Transcript_7158/m.22579 type:complete len:409 (+) Transcript_7158:77-1303(+)